MEKKHKDVLPASYKKTLGVQLKNCVANRKLIKVEASSFSSTEKGLVRSGNPFQPHPTTTAVVPTTFKKSETTTAAPKKKKTAAPAKKVAATTPTKKVQFAE
ncbi:histone H1-like [Papaver somniferum]|uniref:histone H1-like n=1 Tax=Papaver somniferum TaxID=3469 RepID=UPI000E6FCEA6|nr:histone H1-like [Papaver somniferum]